MAQRKRILEDLEALNSLKNLAESYEEVAVVRMQKLRDSVLEARDFLQELSDIFVDLKSSYEREVKELISRRKKGDITILPVLQKNGKALYIYLSSNGKLYGSVTQKTYKLFVQDIKKTESQNTDIIILGKDGKELFENSGVEREFEFVDIPDTKVEIDHIKGLMKKFLPYEKVYVYYGKFGNVVKQAAISTSISGEDIFESEAPTYTPREDKFIFEPTLEKIFHFFETEIMANLFAQTIFENELARHASRVSAMEEALVNIEVEAKKLNQLKNRIKHQLQNKKQLETISGILLWD